MEVSEYYNVDSHMNELAHDIHVTNVKNGWHTNSPADAPTTKLLMIHSEVSEAVDALRHNQMDQFAEELGDVIIRTLDLMYAMCINPDTIVYAKMEKNKTRGQRHGNLPF